MCIYCKPRCVQNIHSYILLFIEDGTYMCPIQVCNIPDFSFRYFFYDCSMLLCTWAYILYNHSKYPISETIFDFMREQVRQQMESATVCPGCLVERPCSYNEDLPDCKHVFWDHIWLLMCAILSHVQQSTYIVWTPNLKRYAFLVQATLTIKTKDMHHGPEVIDNFK